MASRQSVSGYVVHVRNYTDSKKLLSVFSNELGRFSAVYRESKRRPLPQYFQHHLFELIGGGSLKNVSLAEPDGQLFGLKGRALYCAMYINEVVMRLLPECEQYEKVYACYAETLFKLSSSELNHVHEVLLRRFEFTLLEGLGVGINFLQSSDGIKIQEEQFYQYRIGEGFIHYHTGEYQNTSTIEAVNNAYANLPTNVFWGKHLGEIESGDWSASCLKAAKRLSRLVLKPLIGAQPLKSRELFT